MTDKLEIWSSEGGHILHTVESSHAPNKGDLINFGKVTYEVVSKTYTVDYIDDPQNSEVCCVIYVDRSDRT